MEKIEDLLDEMVSRRASDLFLKAGQRPCFRIDGQVVMTGRPQIGFDEAEEVAREIMSEEQAKTFARTNEMDLSISMEDMGRFRINIFRQRGSVAMVFRHIASPPSSFEELNLPKAVERLSEVGRGMVLVTGTTGSGKSTTLAAMIGHINRQRACHIVTIEDPIEFLFVDDKAIVSQREVGFDTKDFRAALKRVMRQSPDVILIGEMRDLETIETAIASAETGHLVLSTLHTVDTVQTVERIINYFPSFMHQQIRLELALCLKGVISQRLLPLAGGEGRIPAIEIMVSTPLIRKLLFEGKTLELSQHIAAGGHAGMQTFNQALFRLYQENKVTQEDALTYATSPEELRLMMEGISSGSQSIVGYGSAK